MTIELAPALEARLREAAAQSGLTVEDYLLDLVGRVSNDGPTERTPIAIGDRRQPDDEKTVLPATPAEAIAYWRRIGVGSVFVGGPDSPELARQLRDEEESIKREPVFTDPAEILAYWRRTGVFESAPEGLDGPELARHWRERADAERRAGLLGDR